MMRIAIVAILMAGFSACDSGEESRTANCPSGASDNDIIVDNPEAARVGELVGLSVSDFANETFDHWDWLITGPRGDSIAVRPVSSANKVIFVPEEVGKYVISLSLSGGADQVDAQEQCAELYIR